jgi:DNA-binding PadR family transcriptional regulator
MCTLVQSASTEPLPGREEVRRLREANQEQYRMIRQLEGQSLLWESVAETRAELIRNLRAALGLDPDVNDEEEQL